MDKTIRNLTFSLVVLIILVPLGLLAVGETFGEWGTEELQEKLGFVPILESARAGLCPPRR
jgi:hypothetical protein